MVELGTILADPGSPRVGKDIALELTFVNKKNQEAAPIDMNKLALKLEGCKSTEPKISSVSDNQFKIAFRFETAGACAMHVEYDGKPIDDYDTVSLG